MTNKKILKEVIKLCLKYGATDAEGMVYESDNLNSNVRLGEVENIGRTYKKSLGFRVFVGKRQAVATTTDFSMETLKDLARSAVANAVHIEPDEYSGLPDKKEFILKAKKNLYVYSPGVSKVTTDQALNLAKQCEAAAFGYSDLVKNSDGGAFYKSIFTEVYANSFGITKDHKSSEVALVANPIAEKDGEKYSAVWYSSRHSLKELSSPETIGRKAAERAVRMVGNTKKISTAKVAVVFDQPTASQLLSAIAEAVSGTSIYQRASFLVGKLGKKIAAGTINIIDDGQMPGGLSSAPFDDDGLSTRKTTVVKNGILKSYLLDTYSARRLKMKSTGNATGSGAGPTNFYIVPGRSKPEEIIASVKNGLYVTDLLGFGINVTNGNFSQGAAGLWIENGKLTHPVKEVTIAGNMSEMLRNITMVGNDLDPNHAIASPTLKVSKMTVSGK